MQILIVAGDDLYAKWLRDRLSIANFSPHVVTADSAEFYVDSTGQILATIVDADHKYRNIAETIRKLRGTGHSAPILVISGREDWREKVESLDAGADDYLVKPVRSEEISARLRAMIRRFVGRSIDRLIHGRLALDLKMKSVWLDDDQLDLTRNEFRLLSRMLLWPERTFTIDDILALLRSPTSTSIQSVNAVEVLINRLRRKVGHQRIRTVRGIGYRLGPASDDVPEEEPE